MANTFRKGQRVEWKSHDGVATGKVVEKITERRTIKGHTADATPEHPQYVVETDDGKRAIHKPDALRRSHR
jgi:hypothetical protein